MNVLRVGLAAKSFRFSRTRFSHSLAGDQLVSQPPVETSYDIVINGGGIVGFSFLAAIQASPLMRDKRVLLIEQQIPPTSSPAQEVQPRVFSNRVSALTESSKDFFQRLNIWHKLTDYAKSAQGMYVWSEHYPNGIQFRPDSVNGSVCYIVENSRMIRALFEQINQSENKNSSVAYGTIVTDIEQIATGPGSSSVQLKIAKAKDPDDWRTLQTRLLIGCDGFKSLVRSKSTLPYFEHDLQQMGIVATLEIESPYLDNEMAFQRFVGDELVIALLPLDSRHSSLVLSIPKRNLQQWSELDDEDFVRKLNQELMKESRPRTGLDKLMATLNQNNFANPFETKFPPRIVSVAPKSRAPFPLGFGTTVPFLVGNIQPKQSLLAALNRRDNHVNTAIIGDAAHRVHPLAGQGLNLGLGDANILAESLNTKLMAGYELFGETFDSKEALSQALFEFERSRIAKLIPMMGAIHSMQTLFNYTPSPLLPIFNSMSWIKSGIVAFANSR